MAAKSAYDRAAPVRDAAVAKLRGIDPVSRSNIALSSVTFTYESGMTALEDLSLDIPLRSRVGIVGPSGCGKSTLLRMLARIQAPTSGSISWPSLEEGVHARSMVFQTDTLLPWLSVLDNIGLAFRLNGKRRKDYAP